MTLDPANAADQPGLLITRHMYEGLVQYIPGTTQLAPALAESWEAAPDGLAWTFRLRGGVEFSDGTPFNAEAARLNFERWLNGTPPGSFVFWRTVFGGFAGEAGSDGEPLGLVDSVAAPNASTLVLTLNRPDGSLLSSLAMPSFAMVSPAALSQPDPMASLARESAGSGIFELAEWSEAGIIRLVRSASYWNASASSGDGPDELVFKVIVDDAQRFLALQTGEIEAVAGLDAAHYEAAAAPNGTTRLAFNPPLNVLYLGFNQARAPWRNLDCRLAVAHALDRDRYARDFFPGDGLPASAMQPESVWGYPADSGVPGYDPTLAAQKWQACLQTGAALPPDATLYVPPIERPYLPQPAALGQAIQADLAAVGISVTVASPDWQAIWLPDVHSGRADLFLLGWSGLNGDPDSFLCPLFCGLEPSFNSDNSGLPLPPDAELAALLLEARAASGPGAREALYQQAHQRFFAALPAVPLAHRQSAWAFGADVRGFVPSPVESLLYDLRLEP